VWGMCGARILLSDVTWTAIPGRTVSGGWSKHAGTFLTPRGVAVVRSAASVGARANSTETEVGESHMSFERRGLGALVAGLLALFVQSPAVAGELDQRFAQPQAAGSLQVGQADLGIAVEPGAAIEDAILMSDLQPVEDFHPETDRWTERTNRIRITPWVGAWLFSDELRIHHDIAVGLRINWEVPGFIGIRWDSGVVPWSRMEVKIDASSFGGNARSSRYMDGYVHSHTLSIAIFNPELSTTGLAFWAGFGAGLWFFNYNENDIIRETGVDGDFSDVTFSGNIFMELDYKIAEVFHVGIGTRLHVLMADHTDDGRFYDLNDTEQSAGDGRNDGILDDLATVTEFTLNFSVLF
jgi:hypothetical protein